MKFTWKESLYQYSTGEHCYMGKWHIGGFHWDSTHPEGKPWKATCRLPGIKDNLANFSTQEEAKANVEFMAEYWLERATEEPKS